MAPALAWIDHEHDQASASDGVSRYGAYLRQRADWFRDIDTTAQFAATAWRVATGPVMSPGLVRIRPDLNGITLGFDEGGEGILRATVRVPLPYSRLRDTSGRLSYPVADWHTERAWDSDEARYQEPRASSERSAVLITAAVIVPVTIVRLPRLDCDDFDAENRPLALAAVAEVVHQVNAQAHGLVDALRDA